MPRAVYIGFPLKRQLIVKGAKQIMKCRICGTEIDKFEEIKDVEIEVNNLYINYTDCRQSGV